MLKVNEIFCSILGEGTFAGTPTAFVRLAGCNLRCTYCDTTYAYENGIEMNIEQIVRSVKKFDVLPVLITGGEPLLQDEVYDLMDRLFYHGNIVLIETNGSLGVSEIPGDTVTIMDIKCPGSGESDSTLFENIDFLSDQDNAKFVLSDRRDYLWARDVIDEYDLTNLCFVLMSPVHGKLDPKELAAWMIEDKLYARISLQIHKVIWGDDTRGR